MMIRFFCFFGRIIVAFLSFFINLPRFRRLVDVAQLVRASDCDSECRGFESRHPPHFFLIYSLRCSTLPPSNQGLRI